MQSRTKQLLISRLIFPSLGQWSNYNQKFWSVYIFLTYTLHELLTYSDNIYLFIYLARGRIFLFTSRACPCGLYLLSRLWFFFFGRRIAFINFVMISRMSYSSRFSSIYWHLVTAWIQWKLLLFGTHSFFSCRFIRAVAYRWTIHWLLWLSTDKQEDIIILSNFIYNKMLACASLPLLCTCC